MKRWIVRITGQPLNVRNRNATATRTDHGLVFTPMPWPDFLFVENIDEEAMIYRFTKDGKDGGDTWHETLEHAREQIASEYPGVVGDWIEIPPEVTDCVEFGMKLVQDAPS